MGKRLVRAGVLLLMAAALSGCTVLGLGIGAMIPVRDVGVIEQPSSHADPGDNVRLVMDDATQITGRVGNSNGTIVRILTPSPVEVPIDHIKTMRKLVTDARQTNAAIPGFLVGFGIDVTIVAAIAIALGFAQQHP